MTGEQLDFAFEGDLGLRPRKPRFLRDDNLFVALRPDPLAALQATDIAFAIKQRHRLISEPQPQPTLHVSLIGFDLRSRSFDEIVSRVSWVLNMIEFKPFEVVFDRVVSFGSGDRKPLVLCGANAANQPLVDLQRRIAGELGLKLRGKLNPHMTLLWDDRMIAEQILDMPVRWTVTEACLIHSLVGRSQHRILWPECPPNQ